MINRRVEIDRKSTIDKLKDTSVDGHVEDSMPEQKKTAVISATFTVEPLREDLSFLFEKAGLELDLAFCPYNQVFQELLSETSRSTANSSGLNIALIRIEDFLRDIPDTKEKSNAIIRIANELSASLSTYAGRAKVQMLLVILSPSPNSSRYFDDVDNATSQLILHTRSLPGITVLTSPEIDAVSDVDKYDTVSDELAHIPFTQQYFSAMALAISRKAHAILKTPYKVLVLDCDNTIWRGVVGEEGISGIVISPAFAAVQRFAIEAHSQGALICLMSKNVERDVLEVFETRKDMILAIDQIVAHRINWNPKPQNIASLAQTLNLGLDSFVFIDDNPVECEQMRLELPQILTLQIPSEDKIEAFLAHLWAFDKTSVTEEDKRRTEMYKENAARQQLEVSVTDIRDFIKSLNVTTEISVPEDGDWPRLAQLTQRTNQFNFTTLRQTEAELRTRAGDGHLVLRVKVKDRFGDYGLVGLVVAHTNFESCDVDIFLLSCRVLGRGVEHTILRHLGMIASERHLECVEVRYLPTSKNEPARAFIESVAAQFRLDLSAGTTYRIPSVEARGMTHRPGQDPDAIIAASKSGDSSNRNTSSLPARVAPSDRYLELALNLTTGSAVRLAVRSATSAKRTLPGVAAPPTSDTESRVLTLWQQTIGIEDLGIDDDYFAIGGSSLLAAQLFSEITRKFRVKLPLTTILDCPTVRTLSHRIEQSSEPASSLVELKSGSNKTLFLVHDGDGETLLYANLARRMPIGIAVLGIEPKTLPDIPLAHATIEDMAAWYIATLKKVQPDGPYLLSGMCAGGVIAYEMAAQLKRAGSQIELLALLDAAAPRAAKRSGRITKHRLDRLANVLDGVSGAVRIRRLLGSIFVILGKLWNAARWEMLSLFRRYSSRSRFSLLQFLLRRGLSWPHFIPALTVREIYENAENQFYPTPLSGVATLLVRATVGEMTDAPYRDVYSDNSLGWGALVSDLTIADVEGGHSSMLQEPFVRSLANTLRPLLHYQSTSERTSASPVTENA